MGVPNGRQDAPGAECRGCGRDAHRSPAGKGGRGHDSNERGGLSAPGLLKNRVVLAREVQKTLLKQNCPLNKYSVPRLAGRLSPSNQVSIAEFDSLGWPV